MRVVALEEHFTVPALVKRIDPAAIAARGYQSAQAARRPGQSDRAAARDRRAAPEVDGRRRHHDAGAVEQRSRPGPRAGPGRCRARAGDERPSGRGRRPPSHRFAGFAVLPMASPDACAAELVRAREGARLRRCADQRHHRWPFPRSSELRRPARRCRRARRADLYPSAPGARGGAEGVLLGGLERGVDARAGSAGWGWHSETAIHVLRMVLAGTLDKHPKLKLIIGHMGEMLPMMLARIDEVFGARHRPSAAADQPRHPRSGLDHDQRHLQRAAVPRRAADVRHRPHHVLGRLSLSPPNAKGRQFLDQVALAPADMAKLTHGNADALLKLNT